jgi:hypothetical protein
LNYIRETGRDVLALPKAATDRPSSPLPSKIRDDGSGAGAIIGPWSLVLLGSLELVMPMPVEALR